jgi:hypothetical protein
MPLPRRKDRGGSGAPVLNLPHCHVRFLSVEEYTEPRTVTRKSDGATFTIDPQFNVTVEVVEDGGDGSHNGVRFYESFRYKRDDEGEWFLQENSKLGMLASVVKPDYFDDDSVPELTADDLSGFEMLCRVKPKKNPSTGAVIGSQIDWETMMSAPSESAATADGDEKVGNFTSTSREAEARDDPDWDELPF